MARTSAGFQCGLSDALVSPTDQWDKQKGVGALDLFLWPLLGLVRRVDLETDAPAFSRRFVAQ